MIHLGQARLGPAVCKTKLNKAWMEACPFIGDVARKHRAFCVHTICNTQMSCSHRGRRLVRRDKHSRAKRKMQVQHTIPTSSSYPAAILLLLQCIE